MKKKFSSVAKSLNISEKEIKDRISDLHEENPMLGHRGCRLAISYPEIYEMQCEAIFKAVIQCKKEKIKVLPEIMIPLVATGQELEILRELVDSKAKEISKKYNQSLIILLER